MTSRLRILAVTLGALGAGLAALASAEQTLVFEDVDDSRRAMAEAEAQSAAARQRSEQLEAEASRVTEEAERTSREAAAVAARIQQAEADIAVNEAHLQLIAGQQHQLRAQLAERQRPLIRLTAALQRLSRRPPVLSLLRPGSVRDIMHLRAVFGTMMPEVERRTQALRSEIARGKALQAQALATAKQLRESEGEFTARRNALAALESRQRLASRAASGIADRESERALALAEQARDLGDLVDELGKAGGLRDALARLPGPVLRPAEPGEAAVTETAAPEPLASAPPAYMLPAPGRIVAGFGEATPGQPRSRGISLAVRAGAQAVAPAAGRVAFAGPYRGYGNIVIIEHAGGWTSLVTGLAQLDLRVGDTLVAGSPLGIAGVGHPVIAFELRRNGEPVNPLEYVRPS